MTNIILTNDVGDLLLQQPDTKTNMEDVQIWLCFYLLWGFKIIQTRLFFGYFNGFNSSQNYIIRIIYIYIYTYVYECLYSEAAIDIYNRLNFNTLISIQSRFSCSCLSIPFGLCASITKYTVISILVIIWEMSKSSQIMYVYFYQ